MKTNQLVAKPLSTEDHFNKELPNVKDKLSGTVVSVNQNGIQVCTSDFKVCFINKNLLRDTYKVGQIIDFHIISIKGNLLYGSTGANKEKARLPQSYERIPDVNGHMASHQLLIDDFCTGVYEGKMPYVNAWRAARYTIPGIIAHDSAMQGGVPLDIPDFGDPPSDE